MDKKRILCIDREIINVKRVNLEIIFDGQLHQATNVIRIDSKNIFKITRRNLICRLLL